MKELKELVRLIHKNQIKEIDVITMDTDPSNKLLMLFHGIETGAFDSDEEAAEALYPDQGIHPSYKKLKSRLADRLYNSLFFIDYGEKRFTPYQRTFYRLRRQSYVVEILLAQGSRKLGIRLAKKVFRRAQYFEFTDIALSMARYLHRHYGYLERKEKLYTDYRSEVKRLSECQDIEILATDLFVHLTGLYAVKMLPAEDLEEEVLHCEEILLPLLDGEIQTNQFIRSAYLTLSICAQIRKDPLKNIEILDKGISKLSDQNERATSLLYNLYFQKLYSYILLRAYEKGDQCAQTCLSLVGGKNNNWFQAQSMRMILAFHTEQYAQALEILLEVFDNPVFKNISQISKERWHLFEAYIHFYINTGMIETTPQQQTELRNFRLSTFLNSMPNYSAKKRDFNVPILIVQVLFLLQQKQYGEITERMDGLYAYTYRYLRKDDTYRSHCFIRLLLALPKNSFHQNRVRQRTAKLFDRLKEVPYDISYHGDEIEIVPYERLWQQVVSMLDNRLH